ncbi:unnamed protein product [Caenorhabditis bovis]|uniref:Uncharacterized protein n=1 Tax=Caenorhabditis bovis TaxID=2654633 RepID=A0A8S1FDP9_9PELO|nr:unnamed protein product [Caenorhabditis bovis]
MLAKLCLITFIISLVSGADVLNGTMKLMLVQSVWRHGDRVPTETYKNDRFTEEYWYYGGGGWGQLTPIGMKQLYNFGTKLRKRYIAGKPYRFLSDTYNQKEVYIRSSDKNRTLMSAFSNMMGMYGGYQQNYNRAGIDYPDLPGWPQGFVPIPIHTIEEDFDHLLIVDNYCPLHDTIWNLAKTTDQVDGYFNRPDVVALMGNLSQFAGEDINPENLWILYSALKIEKFHYPEVFLNFTPWYTDELYEQIDIVNSQVQDFQDGLGLDNVMVKGLDMGKMLKKIRGGTLLNDIYNRMVRKIDCSGNTTKPCRYTENLKFFGYSAHDTTIYALLSAFNISNAVVLPRGYPDYSASAIMELWQDTTNSKNYFKLIYYRNENDTLNNVITSLISGCSSDLCDLSVLETFAETYKPDMEMNQWCDYDILKKSAPSLHNIAILLIIFSICGHLQENQAVSFFALRRLQTGIMLIVLSIISLLVPISCFKNGTMELIMVQTMWRHGDRSPADLYNNDPITESMWTFGGGGLGQLSPLGMKQHLNLGKLLRQRYVNDMQFLSPKYRSNEIYVRSTDVNRTLISAMSNMMGMYGQDDNTTQGNEDYPLTPGWPHGYVPIAIHTVDNPTDHLGYVDGFCPLRDEVWDLCKQSDELQNFINSEEVSRTLKELSTNTNSTIDIDNLYIITQTQLIEQIYFNQTLREKLSWFSDELYQRSDRINDQVQLYNNGIFNNSIIVNGHDLGLLLRKLRGGPILTNMMDHFNLKLECMGKNTDDCKWINNLKNFIYSMHDTTLYAFFSALLVEEYAIKPAGHYPAYSACVLVELYNDTKDNKKYFKMLYHKQEGDLFNPITNGIDGCPQDSDYCPFEILQKYAKDTKPDMPMDQWCFTKLDKSSLQHFSIYVFLVALLKMLF